MTCEESDDRTLTRSRAGGPYRNESWASVKADTVCDAPHPNAPHARIRSSLDMNQDFSYALRALLVIAYNQAISRPTFKDEIINCSTAKPSSMLSIIDTLVSAGIVASRGNVCTLLRSPSSLMLHEIHSITTPVVEGNSMFARLYASLLDRTTSAVSLEFGDLDLQQSLESLVESMDRAETASRDG